MKRSLVILALTAAFCGACIAELATTPTDYLLSDADAGYDQAAYDACRDQDGQVACE